MLPVLLYRFLAAMGGLNAADRLSVLELLASELADLPTPRPHEPWCDAPATVCACDLDDVKY
jgi:hypothetical protein